MTSHNRGRSPHKSKLAKRFEREGFVLEDTVYKILPPAGEHIDLELAYRKVLSAYLGGKAPSEQPAVGWAPLDGHNAWAVFALLDHTILIEKALDDPSTPLFVVEYLLYHEMLHLLYPPEEGGEQHGWHSDAFENAVAAFPRAEEAECWLDARLSSDARRPAGARAPES